MQTVCLMMMVKDNPEVVARAVRTARPLVTSWVMMVNEGDAEALHTVVHNVLGDLPGGIVECPWVNHGANQTLLFAMARPRADYSLLLDGDDMLEMPPGFTLPELTADVYRLTIMDQTLRYPRRQIFSNALEWRSEGAYHETQAANGVHTEELLGELLYRRCHDGARRGSVEKHVKVAAGLEREMLKDPTNTRNAFYLAQSYRDAGNAIAAIAAYESRVAMGGWHQEVYVSHLNIGRLLLQLDAPPMNINNAFMRAYQACPTRAEALYELAKYNRLQGSFHLAYLFAKEAAKLPIPREDLFMEADIYEWRALDEHAIAAYWTGRDVEALALNARLLEVVPPPEKARITSNRAFSVQRLGLHTI